MSFLFGHLYDSPCKFAHDQAMFSKKGSIAEVVSESRPRTPDNHAEPSAGSDLNRGQGTQPSLPADVSLQHLSNIKVSHKSSRDLPGLAQDHDKAPAIPRTEPTIKKRRRSDDLSKSEQAMSPVRAERNIVNVSANSYTGRQVLSTAPLSSYEYSEAWKQQAFEAAQGTGSSNWNDITLVSVSGHQEREQEL